MICCGRCTSHYANCKPPAYAASAVALTALSLYAGGTSRLRRAFLKRRSSLPVTPAATWRMWRIKHGQPAALRTCVLGGGVDCRRRWLRSRGGLCHGVCPSAVLRLYRTVSDLSAGRVDATRLTSLAVPQPPRHWQPTRRIPGQIPERIKSGGVVKQRRPCFAGAESGAP